MDGHRIPVISQKTQIFPRQYDRTGWRHWRGTIFGCTSCTIRLPGTRSIARAESWKNVLKSKSKGFIEPLKGFEISVRQIKQNRKLKTKNQHKEKAEVLDWAFTHLPAFWSARCDKAAKCWWGRTKATCPASMIYAMQSLWQEPDIKIMRYHEIIQKSGKKNRWKKKLKSWSSFILNPNTLNIYTVSHLDGFQGGQRTYSTHNGPKHTVLFTRGHWFGICWRCENWKDLIGWSFKKDGLPPNSVENFVSNNFYRVPMHSGFKGPKLFDLFFVQKLLKLLSWCSWHHRKERSDKTNRVAMEFYLLHLPCSQAAHRRHGPPSKLYTASCPLSLRFKLKDIHWSTPLTSQTSTILSLRNGTLKINPWIGDSFQEPLILQVPIPKCCSIPNAEFFVESKSPFDKTFNQVTLLRMQQSRVWQHVRQHHSASIDLAARRCNQWPNRSLEPIWRPAPTKEPDFHIWNETR